MHPRLRAEALTRRKADLDILRRLKCYIAREVYKILTQDLPYVTLERAT